MYFSEKLYYEKYNGNYENDKTHAFSMDSAKNFIRHNESLHEESKEKNGTDTSSRNNTNDEGNNIINQQKTVIILTNVNILTIPVE